MTQSKRPMPEGVIDLDTTCRILGIKRPTYYRLKEQGKLDDLIPLNDSPFTERPARLEFAEENVRAVLARAIAEKEQTIKEKRQKQEEAKTQKKLAVAS